MWYLLNTTPPVVNKTNCDCWGWHPGPVRRLERRPAPASARRRRRRAARLARRSTAFPTRRRAFRVASSAPAAETLPAADRLPASVVRSPEQNWRRLNWQRQSYSPTSSAGLRSSSHTCGLSGTLMHPIKVRRSSQRQFVVRQIWHRTNKVTAVAEQPIDA